MSWVAEHSPTTVEPDEVDEWEDDDVVADAYTDHDGSSGWSSSSGRSCERTGLICTRWGCIVECLDWSSA